jgi:hypothetical protein
MSEAVTACKVAGILLMALGGGAVLAAPVIDMPADAAGASSQENQSVVDELHAQLNELQVRAAIGHCCDTAGIFAVLLVEQAVAVAFCVCCRALHGCHPLLVDKGQLLTVKFSMCFPWCAGPDCVSG